MNLLKTLKLVIPTILFYAVSIGVLNYVNKISPGGPCVPGGAIFAFLLFIPIFIILVIRDILLAINKDKQYIIRVILHAVILITFFLFAAYS
jgi:membrane protein YdbS with pleckstrin-like domain